MNLNIDINSGGRRVTSGGRMGYNRRRGRNRGRSGPDRFHQYNSNNRQGGFDRDGDADMGGASRDNPHGARPTYRGGRHQRSWSAGDRHQHQNQSAARRLGLPVRQDGNYSSNSSTWFKITIPFARELGKDFIFQSINNAIEVPFSPYCFMLGNDNKATFFIQGADQASALQTMNKRITLPNGFKMIITARQSEAPPFKMDLGVVALMEAAVQRRWNPAGLMLNLSNFAGDDVLKGEGIFASLTRPNVFHKIVEIIEEKIPQIEILDLSDNKLMKLDALGMARLNSLRRLNLARNQLKHDGELETLKNLKLVELNLENNPMCSQFKDPEKYISAIRKRIPKLKVLDGNDLPAPIGTAIDEEESVVPHRLPGSVQDQSVNGVLTSFIAEFFRIFDSSDRQGLLNAYHDQAIFTMSYFINFEHQSKQWKFDKYFVDSRNFMKVNDEGKKLRVVKLGRLPIVSAFTSAFPPTTHDLGSFTVDSHVANAALVVFTVYGVYKEDDNEEKTPPIRAFYRTFVLVQAPEGAGFKIVNDQLTLTNANGPQASNAFTTNAVPSMSVAQSIPTMPSEDIKIQMISQFSQQSGMNEGFSKECLEVHQWNYEKAGQAFIELNGQGKIPPEAFVKSST